MYVNIHTLTNRLDAINQLRINRALSLMEHNLQYIYSLLPTLLHLNHPMLPGYLDGNVPYGICFFRLDKHQIFQCQEIFHLYKITNIFIQEQNKQPITGVYSMGSTSSIGQNNNSDLDIWVFYQSWLSNEERSQLKLKCLLISQWATNQGAEVNFFLIEESDFKKNSLLLDEFYRTAVRMGGKRILWNVVPYKEEKYYDEYVLSLYHYGILSPNEWLDLGRLDTLSVEDYLAASLWQICHSIHSPYKLILKILLLEAYAWEYPHTKLLSTYIKQRLHHNKIMSYRLDPYCIMLEYITNYLNQIKDMKRLDLVRRCFYLKVCEKLSQNLSKMNWRRKLLMYLVKTWGWNVDDLLILDKGIIWNTNPVFQTQKELLEAIIQSSNSNQLSLNNNYILSNTKQLL